MSTCLVVSPPVSITFAQAVPRHPPLQALTLAAVVRAEGYQARIADLYHLGPSFTRALDQAVDQARPSLVLLVINDYVRPLRPGCVALVADRIRALHPRIPVVLVGSRTGEEARAALSLCPSLDGASWGDAEPGAMAAARAVARGAPLGEVPELLSPGSPGPTGPSPTLDLDSLPYPAWDAVDPGFYQTQAHRRRRLPCFRLLAARGCAHRCGFCHRQGLAQWGPVRQRHPDRIVDEIRWLVGTFGARDIQFTDTNATFRPSWLLELCGALRRARLDVSWSCHVRVDGTSPELFREMARAGCWNVLFGAEAGREDLLDAVDKRIRPGQVQDTVRWARDAGIETTASFLFGLPGETPDKARDTIRFALDLEPDFAQFFTTKIFPADHGIPLELGQRLPEWRFQPPDIAGPPFLPVGYGSILEVEAMRDQAYRAFYLRPRALLRQGARLRDPADALRLVQGARALFKVARLG